jgi:hypothetical protein
MHHDDRPVGVWRLIATVELSDQAQSLDELLGAYNHLFALSAAKASPPGFRWINIAVDRTLSQRRTAVLARTLLSALAQREAMGNLAGFRIIAGQHWVDIQASALATYEVPPDARTAYGGAG